MKICVIGNSLTALVLSKKLTERDFKVDLFSKSSFVNKYKTRTIGISSKNIDYLSKNYSNFEKSIWPIDTIKIFTEKIQDEEILKFQNKRINFGIIKYDSFLKLVLKDLKSQKKLGIKKIRFNQDYIKLINSKEYSLIINTDPKNFIHLKYFYKRFEKNYFSTAYSLIIKHKKVNNSTAFQIFTKLGPLAFLPLSKNETSIVFSIKKREEISNKELLRLIDNYNKFYSNVSISKIEKTNLKLSLLKKYYYKNILAFGDCLHQVHPLAGQGFNMNLRDINRLTALIDKKKDLGIKIDSSICEKFEKDTMHLNNLFSSSIDFLDTYFSFNNRLSKNITKRLFSIINNNKLIKKYIYNFANKGFLN